MANRTRVAVCYKETQWEPGGHKQELQQETMKGTRVADVTCLCVCLSWFPALVPACVYRLPIASLCNTRVAVGVSLVPRSMIF